MNATKIQPPSSLMIPQCLENKYQRQLMSNARRKTLATTRLPRSFSKFSRAIQSWVTVCPNRQSNQYSEVWFINSFFLFFHRRTYSFELRHLQAYQTDRDIYDSAQRRGYGQGNLCLSANYMQSCNNPQKFDLEFSHTTCNKVLFSHCRYTQSTHFKCQIFTEKNPIFFKLRKY